MRRQHHGMAQEEMNELAAYMSTLVFEKRKQLGSAMFPMPMLLAAADARMSPSNLIEVESGVVPDLNTFLALCLWLKTTPDAIVFKAWEHYGKADDESAGTTAAEPPAKVRRGRPSARAKTDAAAETRADEPGSVASTTRGDDSPAEGVDAGGAGSGEGEGL